VVTDSRGRILAEAETGVRLLTPRTGWVELDPEDRYRGVCHVIRELSAAAAPDSVAALAMAAASGNTLLTDATGAPLASIVNWMDRRAEQQPLAALADLDVAEVARIAGWPCVRSFPLAHLAWMREHRPDLYERAAHVGMDTDWLLFRLTGAWKMDHSTATTFHLQSQTARAFHEPFLRRLALPRHKLSDLVPSGSAVGPLTPGAARDTGLTTRAVAVAGSFDHPAAARAAGVLRPGQLLLSCGTSWVGFTPRASRNDLLEASLLCDPFLSDRGGPWGGMFSVPHIGRAIDWYADCVAGAGEKDRFRVFDELAAAAPPGAEGVTIDLREPPRTVAADRRNISRAVMEGAARLLADRLRELAPHGFRFERAVLVGGAARSSVWPGIIAAEAGLRLDVGTRHAGALGAAMLAGIGAGLYRDEGDARQAWGCDA
jgi:sugar (pentulose or hexulose) kinase